MQTYSGTVCANCGTQQGPFTRRMYIPQSADYMDMPPGCGVPPRKLRGLNKDERRQLTEKVVDECNARRRKRDEGN